MTASLHNSQYHSICVIRIMHVCVCVCVCTCEWFSSHPFTLISPFVSFSLSLPLHSPSLPPSLPPSLQVKCLAMPVSLRQAITSILIQCRTKVIHMYMYMCIVYMYMCADSTCTNAHTCTVHVYIYTYMYTCTVPCVLGLLMD